MRSWYSFICVENALYLSQLDVDGSVLAAFLITVQYVTGNVERYINSRLLSINHALISSVLTRPVLWVALLPSVPSTHHCHPSPPHSFIPGFKPSFSVNPSHHSCPFLQDWLHRFPRLFTNTSELKQFYFLVVLFSTFSCWFCAVV